MVMTPVMLYAQTCGGLSFAYAFLARLLTSANVKLDYLSRDVFSALGRGEDVLPADV